LHAYRRQSRGPEGKNRHPGECRRIGAVIAA
jgi:hypothetical protein